jgi:hypothetical protein
MGSASSASLVQINAIETSSARTLSSLAVSARVRQCAACCRHSVYNGKAAHGPREDVTRQVGASSCRERLSYSFSLGIAEALAPLCPVWLPPGAVEPE